MADINGTSEDDTLFGTADRDVIRGLDGNDTLYGLDSHDKLYGGLGDDLLDGGLGDDELRDEDGGNDHLFGGDGRDFLNVTRFFTGVPSDSNVELYGGIGADFLGVQSYAPGTIALVDAGSGDDRIELQGAPVATILCGDGDDHVAFSMNVGSYDVTLGSGRDMIVLLNDAQTFSIAESIVARDFATGDAGDVLNLPEFLLSTLTAWDAATNPFASGHLQLDQEGADTILLIDRDGGGDGLVPLLVFENVQALAFTAANLGGFSPDGVLAPGESITGTEQRDILNGSFGGDLINGLGGDDEISGDLGNDQIDGGAGNDQIQGGFGDDDIDGGAGDDQLYGHQQGGDTLRGGDGDDYLSIQRAEFEGRPILLDGGAGNDTFLVFTHDVIASIGLAGGEGADWFRIIGTANASFDGGDGDDVLFGSTGNDRLKGGGGNDRLEGGAGNDTFWVDAGDTVTEYAGEGSDSVYARESFALTAGSAVELLATVDWRLTTRLDLTGNELNNAVIGSDGVNVLRGGAGGDTLRGLGGHDILDGGDGLDQMFGGAGDDSYYVTAGDQVIELAGEGSDSVYAHETFALAAGSAVELLGTADWRLAHRLDLIGNELNNAVTGNSGVNVLRGGAGNDTLRGLGGIDTLDGGADADVMIGGADNDSYYVTNGDRVYENAGEGFDAVYAHETFTLNAGSEVEALATADWRLAHRLDLIGNDFNNAVTGNSGINLLYGRGGADTLRGLGGNDTLDGGTGVDWLEGNAGDDNYYVTTGDTVWELAGEGSDAVYAYESYTLTAGSAVELLGTTAWQSTAAIDLTGNELANQLIGNSGANALNGLGGNDTLRGMSGNDTLDGGADTDILFGGEGNDSFAFTTALGNGNVDTIADFDAAHDRIALDDARFAGLAPGALAAGAFRSGSAALDADDRILYDPATGALYFDADGSGAGAAVQFASLDAGLSLAPGDFTVI